MLFFSTPTYLESQIILTCQKFDFLDTQWGKGILQALDKGILCSVI